MKIRTNLSLLSAAFISLILIIAIVALHAFGQINRGLKKENDADTVTKSTLELNILTFEYLMRHENRMQKQSQG